MDLTRVWLRAAVFQLSTRDLVQTSSLCNATPRKRRRAWTVRLSRLKAHEAARKSQGMSRGCVPESAAAAARLHLVLRILWYSCIAKVGRDIAEIRNRRRNRSDRLHVLSCSSLLPRCCTCSFEKEVHIVALSPSANACILFEGREGLS